MPEGPEVETIVRGLQRIVGASVWNVESSALKGLLKNSDEATLVRNLTMMTIEMVERHGKWVLFILKSPNPAEPRYALLSHLGMHGHWSLSWHEVAPSLNHQRLTLRLGTQQGPAFLTYSDMRSWGRLYTFTWHEAVAFLRGRVGVDATLVTPTQLAYFLREDVRPIAEILLDQRKIAGIGNIYRSEILWRSMISPDRPGTDIMTQEVQDLWHYIRQVMADAIRLRGSSIRDYRDTNGQQGEFQKLLKVYGRGGESCVTCMKRDPEKVNPWPVVVTTKEIDGRTVYYCPICQR